MDISGILFLLIILVIIISILTPLVVAVGILKYKSYKPIRLGASVMTTLTLTLTLLIVVGALITLLLGSKNGFKVIYLVLVPFVCFVYYWLLLFFIKKQEKKGDVSMLLLGAFLILLAIPIVWMFVDFESFWSFVHYPWQKYFEYVKMLKIL